ncbi:PAS domain S-box [Nostoc sp. PCC 7524]|uniref:GAF domain-containing protein n=1 Tax=Nostoc sp. (strain ATCC 29411 / PCC 7524) TaxID=28072 RepID=UPI00029F1562|nr:GAF domain-containing protein [Nostoc sp. PCC 7524]AFY50757.1 PAS domain S-box [Nostoc sp. PCC 7524]
MLLPENENKRLELLHQYQILDTQPEEVFDDLAQLAANICETPIAVISLVDTQREWFKSKVGVTESEIPRSIGLGTHTILQSEILIIPDILQDEKFAKNSLVLSKSHVRFYAGIPLITSDGWALGSLAVMDFVPRHLSLKVQTSLQRVARQVMRQLDLHQDTIIHIQERETIAHALQTSEAKLKGIIESIPIPLIISRLTDGLILYINSEFMRKFRFTTDDLGNRYIYDLYQNPDVQQTILAALAQNGSLENYDIQFKRADGTFFWAIASLQYLNFNNEYAILTALHDITERKNAEAKLQEENSFLQGIFAHIPLMIALLNSDGKVHWVNQEIERVLGFSLQEYQTRNVLAELYPNPEYYQSVINFMQSADRSWRDLRTQLQDGRILDTAWTNIRLPNGQVIGIGQDITERKQTERALQAQAEREQLMRTVAQRIHQSLNLQHILNATVQEVKDLLQVDRVIVYQFAADMSGKIVAESVQPGWQVTLGVDIEDTCFQTGAGTEYYQGQKRAIANIYEAGLTDCHIKLLERFQVKANLVVPIRLEVGEELTRPRLWGLLIAHQCSAPRQWEGHQLDLLDQLSIPIAIAIQQSSIFQQAQNELAERQKAEIKLRSALAEKEVLLKEVHHRVKNNLQIVSGLLQLQSQTLKDPELIKTLRESQNRVESISLIHKNLYTSPNIGQINIAEYIDNLATSILISYQIESGRISLETHIQAINLNVDQAIACGLIINELISNSLKHAFTREQGGKIMIGLHRVGNNIEMIIQDNGIGLPDDINWNNTNSLGLSLVYDLVTEQLEGTVTIERLQGTLFKIQFPQ